MADGLWDVPQTEEGLQALLARLAERQEVGDERAVGWGLLTLSHLVKWVRSDDGTSPFERSHALAREALAIFRRLSDASGTVRALHAAAPFETPDERSRTLAEADRLARESEDEVLVARALAAQGRAMGMRDGKEAARLAREALAIFLRHGEKAAAATCLFGLSLHGETPEAKHEAARESARLFREAGWRGDAARSAKIAVDRGWAILSPAEMEPLIREGLADALADGSPSLVGMFYEDLAKLAAAGGDEALAAKWRREQAEFQTSDGLTPQERREARMAMLESLVETARRQGNDEMLRMFHEELERLRREAAEE